MSHYSAESDFASDATFQKRLIVAMVAKAHLVLAEPVNAGHALLSQKRYALAGAVLANASGYALRFAQASIAYAGSAIGAGVAFAYDGHAPVDPDAPTPTETTTINEAANNGFNDASVDTAVAAVWSDVAGVLPTD